MSIINKKEESEDIFFREKYTFLIQYKLSQKVFDLLQNKFNIEMIRREKDKLVIVEKKDDNEKEA